jgi:hypothetical protein
VIYLVLEKSDFYKKKNEEDNVDFFRPKRHSLSPAWHEARAGKPAMLAWALFSTRSARTAQYS